MRANNRGVVSDPGDDAGFRLGQDLRQSVEQL
jgi:hypothetical protein